MVFESALANTLLVTVVVGAVISGLAALGSKDIKWDWKKFLYSLGIATIAGLGIVNVQFGGVITEGNVLPVVLEIIGVSFIGSKLVNISKKLKE